MTRICEEENPVQLQASTMIAPHKPVLPFELQHLIFELAAQESRMFTLKYLTICRYVNEWLVIQVSSWCI